MNDYLPHYRSRPEKKTFSFQLNDRELSITDGVVYGSDFENFLSKTMHLIRDHIQRDMHTWLAKELNIPHEQARRMNLIGLYEKYRERVKFNITNEIIMEPS